MESEVRIEHKVERSNSISINVDTSDDLDFAKLKHVRSFYRNDQSIPRVIPNAKFVPLQKFTDEAMITLEKDKYSTGAEVSGSLLLNLRRTLPNEVTFRLKCYFTFQTKRKDYGRTVSPLAARGEDEDRLVQVLKSRIGKKVQIVKILQGEQQVAYSPSESSTPAAIGPGKCSIGFVFKLPFKIPSTMSLQLGKLCARVLFIVEAQLDGIHVFKQFQVVFGQLQFFEKKVVSTIDVEIKEFCCCQTQVCRLEVQLEEVFVKRKESLQAELFVRKSSGDSYCVPNDLVVQLWMVMNLSENLNTLEKEVFKLGPLLVCSTLVQFEDVQYEDTHARQQFQLKLPEGLPSADCNEVYSIYYFLVIKIQENDQFANIMKQAVKQVPIYFQI